MDNVVVTGANGFIGSHLVKELLKQNYVVHAIIDKNRDNLVDQPNLFIYSWDDVSGNKHQIPNCLFFYHLAWKGLSGIDRSNYKIQLENVNLSIKAMELAASLSCKKFIDIGSIMEDEALLSIKDENLQVKEGYIYGYMKLLCRHYCKINAYKYKIMYNTAKITNTYGPCEVSQRLIVSTICNLLNGTPKKLSSCLQTYDFIYIDDVIEALILIAIHGKNMKTYVVSSGQPQMLKNYLLKIGYITGRSDLLLFDPNDNPPNLDVSSFDNSSLVNDTGFMPKYSFDYGIQQTIDWYSNNIQYAIK